LVFSIYIEIKKESVPMSWYRNSALAAAILVLSLSSSQLQAQSNPPTPLNTPPETPANPSPLNPPNGPSETPANPSSLNPANTPPQNPFSTPVRPPIEYPDIQPNPTWIEQLNLSREQIEQMQGIRDRYGDRIETESAKLYEATEQLSRLLVGNASPDSIREQYQRVRELKQNIEDLRFEQKLAYRSVLTQQQRDRIARLLQSSQPEQASPIIRLER
jgi:Spy/CpxP family protein refolding chaperone